MASYVTYTEADSMITDSGWLALTIEGCGYEVNEITFEELLERVKGVFEIIKVEGSVEFLTD